MKKIIVSLFFILSLLTCIVFSLERNEIPYGNGVPLKQEDAIRNYFLDFGVQSSRAIDSMFHKIGGKDINKELENSIGMVNKVLIESKNVVVPDLCKEHFKITVQLLNCIKIYQINEVHLSVSKEYMSDLFIKIFRLMTLRQRAYYGILFKIYPKHLPNLNPYNQSVAI